MSEVNKKEEHCSFKARGADCECDCGYCREPEEYCDCGPNEFIPACED